MGTAWHVHLLHFGVELKADTSYQAAHYKEPTAIVWLS